MQPNSDSLHSIDIFLPHEKCVVLCISLKSSFYTIDPEYYRDSLIDTRSSVRLTDEIKRRRFLLCRRGVRFVGGGASLVIEEEIQFQVTAGC